MPDRTRTRRASGSSSSDSRSSSPRRSSSKSGPRSSSSGSAGKGPKKVSNAKPLTPTLEPPDIQSFAEFALGDEIQKAILEMGITKPTPIQALAIEPVLKGKDVIAKAETGTGKTLAFGAPMMAKIDPARASVLGLVMSPTRELAEQVHKVLQTLGEARGIKTALIVGGEPLGPQVKQLQAGAQVVVGTPGRVLDLLNQKFLQFPWTEFAILDEADKMLEIGFVDDIKKILDACNEYRQTLLFSATFPPALLDLARSYTNDPAEIATASGVATVDTINQYVFRCSTEDYAKNLAYLIEDSAPDDVFLVFCERRTDVDMLMRKLERKRFSVKALHGGYDQAARFRVMTAFRTGDVKCMVATDVASRGLDVAHVTHVVNLGLPREFSDYTHRIGRTGRAGRHGAAITFISSRNERDFQGLLKETGFDIEELERPRDLFSQERKHLKAAADEVIDVEGKARVTARDVDVDQSGDQEGEREERRPRRERSPRSERSERRPQPERAERKGRPERTERAEQTGRPEKTERSERPERTNRAERSERPERAERSERPERRPRRARNAEVEVEIEVEAKEVEVEERPARTRGARRPRRSDAAMDDATPKVERSEPASLTESDTEIEERPRTRPRRERSTRRPRSSESTDEAPESTVPVTEAAEVEVTETESRPRRPRRARSRTVEADSSVEPIASKPRAPRKPRARRDRDVSEVAEEAPERGRGGRRPRRSSAEPEPEPKPEVAIEVDVESSPRPRRARRDVKADTRPASPMKSDRESTGKDQSERPKRARRSETVREQKDTQPARPARQGGFGSGV